MTDYSQLAQELFASLDTKTRRPSHDEISAAMRGEMAVMRLLVLENRMLSPGYLSRELDMATPRVAAVLNSLQKKALIERRADSTDKRRSLVALTEEGRALCEKRRQLVLDHMRSFLEQLGEEDAKTFVRLMKRIQSEFDSMPKPSFDQDE